MCVCACGPLRGSFLPPPAVGVVSLWGGGPAGVLSAPHPPDAADVFLEEFLNQVGKTSLAVFKAGLSREEAVGVGFERWRWGWASRQRGLSAPPLSSFLAFGEGKIPGVSFGSLSSFFSGRPGLSFSPGLSFNLAGSQPKVALFFLFSSSLWWVMKGCRAETLGGCSLLRTLLGGAGGEVLDEVRSTPE